MTREEAIKVLIDVQFQFQASLDEVDVDSDCKEAEEDNTEVVNALEMAIKALKQEPCEDAISRDELLKAIDTWDKFGCDANTKLVPYQDHYIPYIHYDDVIKCIKSMPPVTPQPKIGHWIDLDEKSALCSCCNIKNILYGDFCKWCGAKMQEVKE